MMNNTRWEVRGWLKSAEEDRFEDGCQPDSGSVQTGRDFWYAPTLQKLIDQLRAFVPFRVDGDDINLDACDEPGRIDISGMETIDLSEPTTAQLDAWKRGEYRLWYVTYSFHVERVTRETVSLQEHTS